jgi:dephospho-CoA kinase
MYVIGLTGGVASGKSTVATMLAEKGAVVLSADETGWEVYRPGGPAYEDVVAAFGPDVLAPDGSVDRRKLAAIVFADPQARERLNAITHPRIREVLEGRLAELAGQGKEVAVLEAALLLEAGWDDLVDEVWVTRAPPQVARERLLERGLSQREAEARVRSQPSSQERVRRARAEIATDCPLVDTRRIVDREWSRLLAAARSPSTSGGV